MAYQNGADVTADVDLTSDLENASGSSYTPNNGTPAVPSGTRVAGTDGSSVPQSREQQDNTPAPAEGANKGSSVRDLLSAAFKGQEGQPQGQDGAQNAQQPVTDAQGRVRNPDGTFAPLATDAQPQGQNQPFAAPQGLPPAVATQFAQLPAETQQFVAATMEREAQNLQRYRQYDALEQVIAPRREALAMQGMDPAQYVNQISALSDFAGRDPEQFVTWFASQHGIDLGVLAEGAPAVDPQYQALQNELAGVQNQLAQFTQGQQQNQHNSVVQEITQFASEAGQDGKLLRPHFEELGTSIMPFIQAVKGENPNLSHRDVLAQAYDRACWGNPSVRAKLQAEAETARLAGLRDNANRARNAGSSVTGGPLSGNSAPPNMGDGSVRGILQQQFNAQ